MLTDTDLLKLPAHSTQLSISWFNITVAQNHSTPTGQIHYTCCKCHINCRLLSALNFLFLVIFFLTKLLLTFSRLLKHACLYYEWSYKNNRITVMSAVCFRLLLTFSHSSPTGVVPESCPSNSSRWASLFRELQILQSVIGYWANIPILFRSVYIFLRTSALLFWIIGYCTTVG